MSNVLNEAKKQQVIALGRLGWPLRCIEQETGVRRETAGAYLAAGRMGTATAGKTGQRECDQRALSVPLVADASALQVSPHELQARKPTAYQVSSTRSPCAGPKCHNLQLANCYFASHRSHHMILVHRYILTEP
jgi:hypothetical protein